MLDFFIDNIFVLFGGQVFQQTIDIPMVRIVLRYSPICFYTLMRQIFFKNKDRKLAQAINSGFYYIEDVLRRQI
jgi:hypothetical protein